MTTMATLGSEFGGSNIGTALGGLIRRWSGTGSLTRLRSASLNLA